MNSTTPDALPYDAGDSLAGAIIEHPELGLLLQLRDEYAPSYPLTWGLFGGHMEGDEDPDVALRRELGEELELTPEMVVSWQIIQQTPRATGGMIYIYHVITSATVDQLVLHEGKAMAYVAPDALQPPAPYAGYGFTPYSAQALHDFLAARRNHR